MMSDVNDDIMKIETLKVDRYAFIIGIKHSYRFSITVSKFYLTF